MFLGVDIGGTKTAVCLGTQDGRILEKIKFPTAAPEQTVDQIILAGKTLLQDRPVKSIGISCGSPQNSKQGLILSPPNLPGWDCVPITKLLSQAFCAPAFLANDANACALAEWKYGAGQGTQNMIFLTFGTGMGAGLILNGKLYAGSCGMAGEAGHIRLSETGPQGYGKAGSFEGYCSGGGMVRLSRQMGGAYETAEQICNQAKAGDPLALAITQETAKRLGQGLSVLIDLFNPQRIVIGSIFARAEELLRDTMEQVIAEEALEANRQVCHVVAARLGESIGDVAAISVAVIGWEEEHHV